MAYSDGLSAYGFAHASVLNSNEQLHTTNFVHFAVD